MNKSARNYYKAAKVERSYSDELRAPRMVEMETAEVVLDTEVLDSAGQMETESRRSLENQPQARLADGSWFEGGPTGRWRQLATEEFVRRTRRSSKKLVEGNGTSTVRALVTVARRTELMTNMLSPQFLYGSLASCPSSEDNGHWWEWNPFSFFRCFHFRASRCSFLIDRCRMFSFSPPHRSRSRAGLFIAFQAAFDIRNCTPQ